MALWRFLLAGRRFGGSLAFSLRPAIGSARTRCRPLRLEALEERTVPTTFLVTSMADSGTGSLRQAILDADAATDSSTIEFQISGTGMHVIRLLSELPAITGPVTIDGTTQPGYSGHPVIVLNGVSAGMAANGLTLMAQDIAVKALVLDNFRTGTAIALEGPGGDVVSGCYIGTDVTGTSGAPNNAGIAITSANNQIGLPGAGNNICSNKTAGIQVDGDNNVIAGNKIGTDATGLFALPNAIGVSVSGSNNTVGGTAAGAGNVISGNTEGINLDANSSNNTIVGNKIGTDATGLFAIGNTNGVDVSGTGNTVGGTAAGSVNLISGNTADGVLLNGTGNVVMGNRIGTDFMGSSPMPNDAGVVSTGSGNTVGGTTPEARNIISGNRGYGVFVSGDTTVLEGNYIGLDAQGNQRLSNDTGVLLSGPNNLVGGNAAGAGNVISGNTSAGVVIVDDNNAVQGNRIGSNATGSAALSNGLDVYILGSNNSVGGSDAGSGNIITGSATDGVLIDGGSGNTILGNSIFGNAGLGIDLINGGNNNQPAPTLGSATSSADGTILITGTLTGAPAGDYTFELFIADPNDPNQGQVSLGTVTVSIGDDGQFSLSLTLAISPGQYLTATATDAGGNTSMFSQGIQVV